MAQICAAGEEGADLVSYSRVQTEHVGRNKTTPWWRKEREAWFAGDKLGHLICQRPSEGKSVYTVCKWPHLTALRFSPNCLDEISRKKKTTLRGLDLL